MIIRRLSHHWPRVASLIAAALVWQIVAMVVPSLILPAPSQIIRAFVSMIMDGEIVQAIVPSVRRVLVGYVAAVLFATPIGLFTGRFKGMDISIGTFCQALRSIPPIAMVPIAILLLGFGEQSRYFLIFWGAFFPIWLNTHIGVQQVNSQLLWIASSLGASQERLLSRVILPAALPNVVAGMRIAIGSAFVCLVASESSGAASGVGFQIMFSQLVFRNDRMLAYLFTLGAMGAVADSLFVLVLERVMTWNKINRAT